MRHAIAHQAEARTPKTQVHLALLCCKGDNLAGKAEGVKLGTVRVRMIPMSFPAPNKAAAVETVTITASFCGVRGLITNRAAASCCTALCRRSIKLTIEMCPPLQTTPRISPCILCVLQDSQGSATQDSGHKTQNRLENRSAILN